MTSMQKFDFKDITLVPEILSSISSRNEISIKNSNNKLPIIVSPMDTVIDYTNHHVFSVMKMEVCLPRNERMDEYDGFTSISLMEFELMIDKYKHFHKEPTETKILVDIANGHMNKLYDLCKYFINEIKTNHQLMVGNIANPTTYEKYAELGVDYIRVGIGGGSGCLTSANTGIHYPMASLISECYKIKNMRPFTSKTNIVADGGFKKYSDVIKALALGANYVMLGSILNKCLESTGETTKLNGDKSHEEINQYSEYAKELFNVDTPLFKVFRGMSTKEVQKSWGKENLTTSEGVVKVQQVEYTIEGWVNNFESYLKSAMSYTDKKELHQFIGGVKYNHITMNAFKRFDK